jgi:Flp pilus assembly protein TadG
MKNKSSEKGQALIMIAVAGLVLFAFASLAIDGSMVFSDRRQAQNAADTAVMSAALAKVRGQNYTTAAVTRATSNGYDNNGTTNNVDVYNPPVDGNYAGNAEYVEVKITSHVKTYFAQVIGTSEVVNHTQAVARAVLSSTSTLFGGQALVALNKTACPALQYNGSSSTTVTGSGIFVNSNCDSGSNQALNSSSGSAALSVPCMSVVGGVTLSTNATLSSPGINCANSTNNSAMQIGNPMATFATANIPCGTTAATYTSTTLKPGNYSGAFPPGGQTYMESGIYCVDAGNQGFTLQGGQTLTGSDVLIYMKSGNVKWTSGGIHISAISDRSYVYSGLLLYMDPGNCSQVSISGNGTSSFIGTILAPCSNVSLSGGSTSGTTFNNQIISDTITLTGSNALTINFDASQQWQPPKSPSVELTQ